MQWVLVTGSKGYIGSHICKQLYNEGYGVVGVDRDNSSLDYNKYIAYQPCIDYDDLQLIDIIKRYRIETVIHTAATSLVGPSVKDPDTYYKNNVDSLRQFLTICRNSGIRRIVYSSSAATYGDGYETFSEDIVNNPISPYGRTKMIGEWMLEDYCRAYNMSAVALRYFNVCGADADGEFGQLSKPSHIISVAMTRALKGESITINGDTFDTVDGTCERDYIHVTDVAQANVCAMSADVDVFVAVNIGSGLGYSNLEIVKAVNEYTDLTLDYDFGPARPGDPARLVCDNTKARQALNWDPQYSDLKNIIVTAEQWHKSLLV
jgi:UDP-glucose-4-epimerase GalE